MVGIEEWIAIFEISLSGYLKEKLRWLQLDDKCLE
jgi:hypothetical protein